MNGGNNRETVVVGVGAVGCRLAEGVGRILPDVRCVFIDTDRRALHEYEQDQVVLLETSKTGGSGTGKRPELAREAAEQCAQAIGEAIGSADLAVVAASFGGGTGAGAGPVAARVAREAGAFAIVAAVDPFKFESALKTEQACAALLYAGDQAEAVVRIPCCLDAGDNEADVSFKTACIAAENHATDALAELVRMAAMPGVLLLDEGDLRRVLCEPGGAGIGVGRAEGDRRVETAIRRACNSLSLDAYRIHSAASILLHVAGGEQLSAQEVQDGARAIGSISAKGDYLLSVDIRPELGDRVIATVLLSGFYAQREDPALSAEADSPTPEGAFIYEGINIDIPTFLRRSRGRFHGPLASGSPW